MRAPWRLAAAAVAVAAAAAIAGPALADPINPATGAAVAPRACDIVGTGSNTTQYLYDQISADYDKSLLATISAKHQNQETSCAKQPKPFIYSWDGLQNSAGPSGDITYKAGCPPELRPNGSAAGITALADGTGGTTSGHPCLDYARSSRGPAPTDPPGLNFLALALDNVTYASISKGSNAPDDLSLNDLRNIYACNVRNWSQLGGGNAPILPLLPQAGSGLLAFFEAAIGVTTPGACVTQPATLAENEGTNSIFTGPAAADEIIPFSAGRWAAQEYRSPACFYKSCPASKNGVFIKCQKPAKTQNRFGCDVNGVLKLNDVGGTDPLKGKFLNPPASDVAGGYTNALVRTLYTVVRGTKSIPGYLQPFFSPAGYFCAKTARTAVTDYGFEVANLTGFPACGT
jgi:ABC-type phosphate transport system substrate-binding protein